jgi:pentatricopeptide repeat protein
MQSDGHCKVAVNAVIYCSLLKGFAREKKLDRAWAVYQEMKELELEMSTVACNTVLDACARIGRMERVPGIWADMRAHGIKPNLITFSTTMKGHCQAGDIQTALNLMEEMQHETDLKPDEIMYNSILDGCAQHSLVDEGLRLLNEMQSKGVNPSNFTLSVLVKLLSRARKPLDQSFNLVRDLSHKYGFKPNVHVYTNLIQACTSSRQLPRAIETLETMVSEHVQPDSRTYTILVRACVSQNKMEQAAAVLRSALGLPGALPALASAPRAICWNLDNSLVNETLVSLATRGFAQTLASPLLADLNLCKQKIRVDASTRRQVTSADGSSDRVANAPWRKM